MESLKAEVLVERKNLIVREQVKGDEEEIYKALAVPKVTLCE